MELAEPASALLSTPDELLVVASLTLISSRPTAHGPADPDLPEVSDALMAAWDNLTEPA